ncbi:MAG TPA: hypothetical protein VJ732_07065, partial [Bryobacteraceae bacterium]|nr:hypothetical protein [Bryobacteraceae bacterium]
TGTTGSTGISTGTTGSTGTTTGTTGIIGTTGTTGTTTGSTGTTGATATGLTTYSAVGDLQLSGNGTFVMHETVASNGNTQNVDLTGTYTVSSTCTLTLTFSPAQNNGTGTQTVPPVAFIGTFNTVNGAISVQPVAGVALTGIFVPQYATPGTTPQP